VCPLLLLLQNINLSLKISGVQISVKMQFKNEAEIQSIRVAPFGSYSFFHQGYSIIQRFNELHQCAARFCCAQQFCHFQLDVIFEMVQLLFYLMTVIILNFVSQFTRKASVTTSTRNTTTGMNMLASKQFSESGCLITSCNILARPTRWPTKGFAKE